MANGGNINYNVRFNADTSGLNRPVQELQKIQESLKAVKTINIQLATAGKTPEEIQRIISELTEAQNAAKLVETALKKSFNTKLNTFNITNFNNELKKSGTNITEIGQKLMKSGAVGAAAFRNIENQIGKVNLQVKQSNKLFDEMATTMMNSIKWGITSSIWNNMTGSIEKAWGFAKKLDSSLNDIRIVTDKSAQDMEKFAVQANKAAKSLGSSTTGYTEASLIYYQQGLSDAEVQARTETTLKAANVTGQSAAEVSEQLTAVWNGYKVSAEEAELYVDKLSAVAATTAADLEELSTGMSKVASAASIMGVDIDQLNAQLATVVSVTRQAPESVGTAFKTIYARMGDIEAGLDTETSLGEYTKKMNEMGFNVLDTNGKLKDMGSVIEEIGNKWTSLSREQQVALSQTMAGTRQYNNLLALFDNWDEYTESLETSRDAAGSLQKQQDIYMESMEAHLQKLSTEGERVYNNLFDANTVNPLIDALTSLVSLLADFVDGIGGIGPILLMLGSIGTKTFSKQIGEGIATSIINSKNAKRNAEELASQYQLLDSIAKKFSNDLVGQQAAMDKSINSLARQGLISQERADELRAFSSALGETGNRIDELKIKQEEYNKVAKEGKENAQQLDKDNQDQSNYTSTATLLERISEQRKTAKTDDDVQLEDAIPAYRALNEELDRRNEKLEETRKKLDQTNVSLKQNIANNQSLANIINQQGDISKAYQSPDFQHQVGSINKSIKIIQEQYKAFEKDLSEEEKASFEGALSRYQTHLQKLREAGSAGTLTSEQIENFQKYATEVQQEFETAITNGFNEGLENAEDAIENVRQAARQAAEGSLEQNQQDLTQAEADAEETQENFKLEIANEQLKQITTSIVSIVGGLGQIASASQMIVNIFSIWNDDSLSLEEKMKQIIPLLIAAIPMIMTGISTISAALPGAKAGMISLMVSSKLLTAAEVEAATAAGTLGTAIWTALAPILPIILTVVAAIGLLVAAGVALYNSYNADAIAAKKAAEAAKEAASAAEKAKTAYEELANTIKGYDDAVNSLKELTKGTQEYAEALEEANAKAIELISANAELANHVSRNSEGLLVFDESVKDNVLETARKRANQAQAASYLAQAQAGMAQNKSEITDLGRSISFYDANTDRIETAQSVMPSIIKAIQEKGGGLTKAEIAEIPGIDDRLIPLIQDHMAEIVKQTKATEALNQTNNVLKDEILRTSLENNQDYANRSEAEKNVIATVYGKGIELSEDSEEYQNLVQEAETKYKDVLGDDSAMQKEYAQKMGYTHISDGVGEGVYMDAEGNEQKVSDEIARTWLKQQYIAEQLANYNETGLENISNMVDSVAVATKDFSQSTQDEILGVLAGDKEFDSSNLNKEDFEKLQTKSASELKEIFKDVDFSSLGENGADIFIQNLQEGLNNLDWSNYHSSLISTTTSALNDINNALKDFKLGEKLDDEVISTLESKFPELKRIWDKTSQEYYDALRKAQEETEEKLSAGYDEQGKYEYGEIGAKQTDYKEALEQFEEISGKSQKERFQESYDEAYDEVAETAKAVIEEAAINYGTEKDDQGNYKFTNDQNVGTWMDEDGKSSEKTIAYDNAKKYAGELEAINSALQAGKELTEEQKEFIDGDYNEALKNAATAAENLKAEVEDTFKADYELEISITNDLLSDVDEIVTKAENARTAVEMIGEGFKVSAENSEELLTIFPELAHNAQVLADGTIQLDDEVVKEVLDNDALEIDSMTDVTATAIDNRIAELEADKAAMETKLEDLHNTSVAEFNVQEFLGENYQEFKEEEVNANALAAQDEVSNSALSAKAVITNWQAKIDAAKTYAAIAAAAEAPGHDVSGVADNVQEYVDNTVSSVDTSDSVNMTEEEKKQKEEELERINQELYNLTEDYLTNKIASDEKQIAQLIQSKSELYAGIKNIETAATENNIDLLDDEIDRYHDINIQLEQINRQLDRLQKTREHLTGKTLIKNYNEEIKLLQKQIKLSKEKQKIQLEEAKELKGQLLTFGVTFNDDNTVANYAEIMAKYIKEVNAAKASGNEDAAKAAEERYEYFKKNFERYEELINSEMPDLIDEITELGYQKISQKIEKFNTTLQVELDTRQAKRDWKDFLKEMTVADTNYSGQASYLKSDTSSKLKDLESTLKAFEKSNKALENGIGLATGAADAATTKSRYYDAETGVFDGAAAQEETQNYISSLTELSLNIKENMTALGQTFLDTLDQANEKIQDALDGYDDINNALNHGIKLQQLFNGEDDYAGMADYYSDIVTNTNQQIKLLSQNRDRLADEIVKYSQDVENAEKTLEDAKKSGDAYAIATAQNNYDLAKQALDSTYDAWVDTTENLYSTIETQYENLKNQYLNDVNKILDEITKQLTGGASLSYLSDEWDLINKSADKYLDTVNATYEVQTLEGKYLKSINNTTSISAQKKLNKVMDEELESLREKDKLTQYDIDRANKKYELTLKQIALEEAQNNKSSMRLRRDAQGNYSYQFVADEDAISDAEQEVAAAENDLYNFDKEQYQNTLNEALTLYSEWQQKLKEAAEINDPEERAKKEAMINKYYQDMIYQTVSDNTTAQQNLQSSAFGALSGMYATNLTNFEAMTDGMFGDFSKFTIEDMPSLLAQMVAGYDGSIQQMVNAMGNEEEGFIAISNKAFTDLIDSAGTFDSAVTTLRSNLEENGGAIRDDINKTKLLIDKTKGAADNLVSSLSVVIGDQYKTVRDGLTKLGNKYIEVGKQIEAARTNAQNLLSTLNTLNGTKVNPQVPTIDANPTAVPTFGSSGGSSTDSVSGAGTEEEDKYIGTVITWKKKIYPWKYKDSGGKPISLSMAELWGEEIEGLSRGRHPQELQTAMKNAKIEWEVLRKDGGRDSNSYLLQNKQTGAYAHIETSRIASLDTGGYTGEWGAEGRMAMLHEKEIVLNKMDTENILNAVSIVRGLDNMVSKLGATFLSGMTSLKIPNIVSTENNNSTAQTVNITAKFPDVTSAVEIEKALKNLVNIASQRAQSVK